MNRDGFRPDPEKIELVINYPAPCNLKQLRRFMGMASWYRKFLKDFATLTAPLTALTKKDRRYEWGEQQQEAFERIKGLIVSALVLVRSCFVRRADGRERHCYRRSVAAADRWPGARTRVRESYFISSREKLRRHRARMLGCDLGD